MSKQTIREQFGAQAAAYVDSPTHARGASLARLIELLNPQPSWQALDVATGAGHTAIAVAPCVAHVRATDITPQMLQEARRVSREKARANVTVEYADAEALPYEAGSFDLVTCRLAAHHFGNLGAFLREAARVLRPGGYLAVVDNIVPPGPAGAYVNAVERLRDPSHNRCLSVEEWSRAFLDAGLAISHQETLAKRLDFSFWAQRHDPVTQEYLRALFTEASGLAAAFLQPESDAGVLAFRLVEGLTIGRKETP